MVTLYDSGRPVYVSPFESTCVAYWSVPTKQPDRKHLINEVARGQGYQKWDIDGTYVNRLGLEEVHESKWKVFFDNIPYY
ncbi:hypothetical protein PENSPDRAFT_687271 [Peniophora sp. CONT]|nr:hypothetical protein PENSPDRAFT_687271 [Peniophora sp. CONT]